MGAEFSSEDPEYADSESEWTTEDEESDSDTCEGCPTIHTAAFKGHTECVKNLLEAARKKFNNNSAEIRAKVCKPTSKDETPLSMAAKRGHWDTVEELSSIYADASAKETGYALHIAARENKIKCIEVLVKKLPHLINSIVVDEESEQKYTPISLAAENKNCLQAVKILTQAGADVNHSGIEWMTPLQRTIFNRQFDVTKFLLKNGANPTFGGHAPAFPEYDCEEEDMVPLSAAVSRGSLEIAKLLAESAPPKHGTDAIIMAACFGQYECLKFLLEKGFPTFEAPLDKYEGSPWRSVINGAPPHRDVSPIVKLLLLYGTGFHDLVEYLDFSHLRDICGEFLLDSIHLNTFKLFLNHGLVEMRYNCQSCPNFTNFAKNVADLMYFLAIGEVECCKIVAFNFMLFMDYFPFAVFSTGDDISTPDYLFDPEIGISNRFLVVERLPKMDLKFMDGNVVQVVPKLVELCRWRIRCSIVHIHDSIMPDHVEKLPLPNALKSFLLYKKSDERVAELSESLQKIQKDSFW